jgi:hypothetical protein
MLLIALCAVAGETRALAASVVNAATGKVWDFHSGYWADAPAPADCLRPILWLTSPVHEDQAIALLPFPRPAEGEAVVYFHEELTGGALVGDPVPVQLADLGQRASVAVAISVS